MTEEEFISSIDCRFPYMDTGKALKLVDQACSISANAAFMVVSELACPPHSAFAPAEQRHLLLDRIDALLSHPLKDAVIPFARRRINCDRITGAESASAMRFVARFRNEYNALAIVCWSSADDTAQIDDLYDEIVHGWKTVLL